MSSVYATVVELGTEVIQTCPDCGETRSDTPMVALTGCGPIMLGMLVACDGCGDSFRCCFCVALVAHDGALIFQHMRDQPHG